jgi:NAD(P)-dependent dehydrogenase (short-subunit alcohol dehydrogenase family)
MTKMLANQTVVVIGGSGGLGAAVASLAEEQGGHVIAISRSGKSPRGVKGIAADVTDLGALGHAIETIGSIDHLVHTAAARGPSNPLSGIDQEGLTSTFATKLFAAIQAARLALPFLSERASITLTSGQVSRKYGTGSLVKGIVNAAVEAGGRHLAKELAPRRVNVISPGLVDTSLWGEAGSEARTAMIARASANLPVKRIGSPEELAAAYLFAMTNGFVTGAVIDVDGGGLL